MVVSCDSAGGEKRIVDQDFARGEKRIVDQDSARGGTARAILCAPQALLPKQINLRPSKLGLGFCITLRLQASLGRRVIQKTSRTFVPEVNLLVAGPRIELGTL